MHNMKNNSSKPETIVEIIVLQTYTVYARPPATLTLIEVQVCIAKDMEHVTMKVLIKNLSTFEEFK